MKKNLESIQQRPSSAFCYQPLSACGNQSPVPMRTIASILAQGILRLIDPKNSLASSGQESVHRHYLPPQGDAC